jgi:hypothetical protein
VRRAWRPFWGPGKLCPTHLHLPGGGCGKFFGANVNFALKNPVDGGNRVTVEGIIEAINDGKFLFDIDDIGGDDENPGTGFVQGSISGGLDISLALAPDGAIAGLPLGLGGIGVSAQSSDWLTMPPTPSVTFTKPTGFEPCSTHERAIDDIILCCSSSTCCRAWMAPTTASRSRTCSASRFPSSTAASATWWT